MFDLTQQAPAAQAGLVIGGTFVLEDAATVLTAVAARAGVIRTPLALASLWTGIVLGDLGLYGLGMLSTRVAWARRLLPSAELKTAQGWARGHVFRVVFASRFVPGARLPTYTACGFLRIGIGPFAMSAVLATLVWTTLLFQVSLLAGGVLIRYLGPWRWAAAGGFALVMVLMWRQVARMRRTRA